MNEKQKITLRLERLKRAMKFTKFFTIGLLVISVLFIALIFMNEPSGPSSYITQRQNSQFVLDALISFICAIGTFVRFLFYKSEYIRLSRKLKML